MALEDQETQGSKPTRLRFTRRGLLQAVGELALGAWVCVPAGAAISIEDRLSPRNRKRPRRPHTDYIVLHTTEGEETGSLHKVQRLGETHYFVGATGKVYRIIDKDRIATHAGRSMWQGHSVIDNYSIAIEVVGHYDQDIAGPQYTALRSCCAN